VISKSTPKVLLITGCERSGTTILQHVVNTHPSINVPNEQGILSYLVWSCIALEYNGFDKRIPEKHELDKPWTYKMVDIKMFANDRHSFSRKMAKSGVAVWKKFMNNGNGLQYIGDKDVGFVRDFDILKEWLHPKWLMIHRCKEDTIASMKRMTWNLDTPEEELESRYELNNSFVESKESDPDCFVLSHERLCADPNGVKSDIADFLDLRDEFDFSLVNKMKVN